MGRRRLSDPRTAQVEDGRRAIDTEEGVIALLFSYAQRRDFLRHDTGVNPMTVRAVMDMTGGLEVSLRTRWDWEYAILDGYRCWHLIREWRGGDITVDLGSGSWTYSRQGRNGNRRVTRRKRPKDEGGIWPTSIQTNSQ